MKCIEIREYGGPEVLVLAERPVPVPGAGELLIRVSASGVNRPDVLQRTGHYPVPPGASDLPGLEVAGVIESGDAQAMAQAGFAVGDRVCALVAGGGYAQYCVAPVAQCLPVPAGWSDVEAASLPETFFTVWSNVFDRGRLQAGETLLVHGGTSGIGVTAIQLAKAAGADHAINYRTADFVEQAMQLTGGQGVNVVLDMVAGDYIRRDVECLAEDGRVVIIAVQGGVKSDFNAGLVLRRRLTITGSTLRARSVAFKGAIAQALKLKVWPWLESRRVQPVIHSVFPADEAGDGLPSGAARAHALMQSGDHVGKIVLTWRAA